MKSDREVRKREAQFCETANSLVQIDKFQQPFPEENASCHQS